MAKRKNRTTEERKALMETISAEVKSGKSILDACKEQGIHMSYYYKWMKALQTKTVKAGKKLAPELVTLTFPTAEDLPMFLFMGKASDLNHALDRIAELQRGK
jgi:1,2-phenylacetyl-CoA epoxidase catalytic subunit